MKFVSRMKRAAPSTNSARCFFGSAKTGFAAFARNQYRLLTAPSSTRREGHQGEEMTASLTNTGSLLTESRTNPVIRGKGQRTFSLIFLLVSILILATSSAKAQAGSSIFGQVISPGGTPAAFAQVTVCPYTASGTPCSPQASVYADANLTPPALTQPTSADQYGNFNVFVAPGTYLVQIRPNTTVTYSYTWTANGHGTGTISGAGSPSVACSSVNSGQVYVNVSNGSIYTCTGSSWTANIVNGNAISPSTVTATGSLPVSIPTGLFGYGSLGYNDSNTVAAYSASVNSYFQAIIQNTSSGTGASADYVVSNNLGTATTYYGDFGMNSSGFSGTGSGSLPNAVYMTANNGDLVLGTNTSNYIRFYVNGGATDSLRITSAGVIQIPGIAAASGYNCVQIDSSGNITNTGSACGSGGSGGSPGGVGNGFTTLSAVPGLPGTGTTGQYGSGVAYSRNGDSTVAYDQQDLAGWYPLAQQQGQSLWGTLVIKKVTSPYTCSSNNYVFTVDNSGGWFNTGDLVQTNGGVIPTGSLTQEEFNERWATVISSTATTVTIAYASGSATVNCTTGGTWSGPAYISPNAARNGNPGITLTSFSGTALTNTIAALEAKAALGYVPVFAVRIGINDWRLDATNFPTHLALVKTMLTQVQAAMPGIPMIYIGPNSVNANGVPLGNSGGNAMCQAGQTSTGNCAAGTIAAATLPGAISAGSNTVTLVNPTGKTYCPPSLGWAGPGAAIQLNSHGNPLQYVINYGGGNQETVTVTAFTPTVTDNTHYTCTVTFTTTNSHSSGEPVMATNLSTAQAVTDNLHAITAEVAQSAGTTYPTLQVLDTQDLIYGHVATATKPAGMTDALHPNAYQEDNKIGQMLASFQSMPTMLAPDLPQQTLNPGQTGDYAEYTSNYQGSFDPAFSEQYANTSRQNCGYWQTGNTVPCYPLWAEDSNYFQVQGIFKLAADYTAGTTGVIQPTSLVAPKADIRYNNTYPNLDDILCVPGVGCWTGIIGGAIPSPYYNLLLTLNSPGIPVNLPSGALLYIMRPRVYDYSGIPYLRQPNVYAHFPQGYWTAGGSNTYTVNYFTNQLGAVPENSNLGVGTIYTFGSSPVTVASIGTAGSGYDSGGTGTDTVTTACGATLTINVTTGVPTSIAAITAGGTNCVTGTNQSTTGGTGTGFKVTTTAGVLTAPSGTTCAQSGGTTGTLQTCTDSSGTNYAYLNGLPVDIWGVQSVPPDVQATNVAASCLVLKNTGSNTGYPQTLCGNNSSAAYKGTVAGVVASGQTALGTSAIGSVGCATTITVSAAGVVAIDRLDMTLASAPGTGWAGLTLSNSYVTANNVNFVVCNPTAGSITPAAINLNWAVVR